MNVQLSSFDRLPSRDEAAEALALLRCWASDASQAEVDTPDPAVARLIPGGTQDDYPVLSRGLPG